MSAKFNNYYVLIIVLSHYYIVDQQPIGHLQKDVKPMRVGEQVFHVSKNLLELVSLYSHRMLNNPNFVEANQYMLDMDMGEIEAALFHDFPQNIIPSPSIIKIRLPDSQNLAGLLRLARYYDVDSLLSNILEHSLKLFREIPITERILLAKKYGGKEFNVASLLNEVVDVEDWKSISMALFKGDD